MSLAIAAAMVHPVLAVVMLLLFVALLGLGVWVVRSQNRMFPDDFDRTGWNPQRGDTGWFRTKFTWLSGGRG